MQQKAHQYGKGCGAERHSFTQYIYLFSNQELANPLLMSLFLNATSPARSGRKRAAKSGRSKLGSKLQQKNPAGAALLYVQDHGSTRFARQLWTRGSLAPHHG